MKSLFLLMAIMIGAAVSAASQAATVSATCKDGSTYTGATKHGACHGHGGVQAWMPGAASSAPAAAPAPAGATAMAHPTKTTPSVARPGGGHGQVWVNTASKVYHCAGSKSYGTTKEGKYMPEADAKAAGFRPSYNKACTS